jgi:hypothetical protein
MTEIAYQEIAAKPRITSAPRPLYRINPLRDPRWSELVQWHPRASIFHSVGWLEALRRTYGYEPVAYTKSPPGKPLDSGMVFCRVESWLTGRRLVSLPFSDHCDPLMGERQDLEIFSVGLEQELREARWRYIELRPLESLDMATPLYNIGEKYTFHQLDLRPDLNTLFLNFHKNSTQRKIKRAEREALRYEEGRSKFLVNCFYRLITVTRRRHHLPPQPKAWFSNLIDCCGDALKIRMAFKNERPLAGILTLRHKETLVYKYGCTDVRFNKLGSMHLLFWKAIQEAKADGLRSLDFGRSNAGQSGLITFKSRWGAAESSLNYGRLTTSSNSLHVFDPSGTTWKTRMAKQLFARAPGWALSVLGNMLYKHVG